MESLVALCASHGIEPRYTGIDGVTRDVSADTLAALADIFGIADGSPAFLPDIETACAEPSPLRCHVPAFLANARVWGVTCQLASLSSERNLVIGDYADLSALCTVAANEGADFVGVNPLHALFWSDPGRVSPFAPSNRRFLNPLYIALEWVAGFGGLSDEERAGATRASAGPLIDHAAVWRVKSPLLRRCFNQFPWNEAQQSSFRAFCDHGGDALAAHATYEAIAEEMVAEGNGPTMDGWPEPLRRSISAEVAAFVRENRARVDFHLWLQWVSKQQLDRVQREARDAGLRIGLFLDFAVGAAPDGSAAWADPKMTVPGVSIGAPPDPFSIAGQDWGLAPLSPMRLAAQEGEPLAATWAAVMRGAGAVRIDHAMGIARLWLIPRGASPTDGAYVRFPLSVLLRRLAEVSEDAGTVVVGEDLGVVPHRFRDLMAARSVHSYKVYFFERDAAGRAHTRGWPVDALACIGTHDMPTFAAWWRGDDIEARASLGLLERGDVAPATAMREREREAMCAELDRSGDALELSLRLHAHIASSPCRLSALQLEDALGLAMQVNIPGTATEHPNWRQRLPVAVSRLGDNATFRKHTAAMRAARPR